MDLFKINASLQHTETRYYHSWINKENTVISHRQQTPRQLTPTATHARKGNALFRERTSCKARTAGDYSRAFEKLHFAQIT